MNNPLPTTTIVTVVKMGTIFYVFIHHSTTFKCLETQVLNPAVFNSRQNIQIKVKEKSSKEIKREKKSRDEYVLML